MSVELPAGWSAWTRDGRPVRRAITLGYPGRRPVAFALGPPAADIKTLEQLREHTEQLWADAVLYGDAWGDLENHRVDPREVQVTPPTAT